MKFHDELNPKLWQDFELKEEVADKLEEITEAFISYLDIPAESILDVVITGSSANYNYTEYSDLDLHLIIDYEKVHKDCPIVEGYLWSMKSAFNKEHDISVYGIDVELYAEDSRQSAISNGVYSLLNAEWIKKPQKIEPTENDAAVEAKYHELKTAIEKLDDSEEAEEILDKVYEMRKSGLANGGEFSTENLAFKMLRNEGYIDMLKKIKKEKIDKQLTLESYNESVSSIKLKNQLENKIKQFFKQDEDALHWAAVDITEDSNEIKVEVRVELSYKGMWDLSELLNPIVSKYDKYAYFDFDQPGIMVATIERKNSSRINELDSFDCYESFQSLDRYKLNNKDDYNKAVKVIDEIIKGKQTITKEEYSKLLKAISRNEKEAHTGSFTIDYQMVKDKAAMQKSKILQLYKNSKNESYVKKVTKELPEKIDKQLTNRYLVKFDGARADEVVYAHTKDLAGEMAEKKYGFAVKEVIFLDNNLDRENKYQGIIDKVTQKNEAVKIPVYKMPYRVTTDGASGHRLEFQYASLDKAKKDAEVFRKNGGTAIIRFSYEDEYGKIHTEIVNESIKESKSIKELNRQIEQLLKD